jgi:hypothetical protein
MKNVFAIGVCLLVELVFANTAQSQKKVVALGSSTTMGAAATSGDSSWVGRLQAYFRRNTSAGNPDTVVIAMGAYGYTTFKELPTGYVPTVQRATIDEANNVTAAVNLQPDIVIINLPSNDVSSYGWDGATPPYSTKETMDNFRVMYQYVVNAGIKCFITTTQPRNDMTDAQRLMQRNLVDSIRNNFGLYSINFWDDLVTQDGTNRLRDEVRHLGYSDQDYHLNNYGHSLIFQRVVAKNIFNVAAAPPAPTYINIPGTIEAENYTAMYGIQTENTADVGGGKNVGWQDTGDWMDYDVNVSSAGTYQVNFRVASFYTGAQFQLRKGDGTVLTTMTVPNTGNWQSWTTISANVFLASGAQTLRIFTSNANGGWNLNWLQLQMASATNQPPTVNAGTDKTITLPTSTVTLTGTASDADGSIATYAWTKISGPAGSTFSSASSASTMANGLVQGSYIFRLTVTDNQGASASDDVAVTVNAASTSNIIHLEAESYTAMYGIQTENTADAGGGLNVGWQDTGDWMDYSVNIPTAGTYPVNFRIASFYTGAQFQLRKSDGTVLATMTVPNTGNWQSWTTISANVLLPAGQQTLRIYTSNANGGWNLNWLDINLSISAPAPAPTPTSLHIEAENYTSMSGIQTENTADAGGGLNVGWQENGDWMDYSVNISTAGTYTLNFRVATVNTGAQFQLRNSSGSILTTVTVPYTSWWQTWQTVSATVTLPAGQQTLRIVTTDAKGTGWNLNWWEITPSSNISTSLHIEAETYSSMSGIQTENTADTGGGLNVGWQENGDWMDYPVNVPSAGVYTLKFRVATVNTGVQFQLRKGDGTLVTTVTVPNTGWWQTWQTTAVTNVLLPAGQQTLRIITTDAKGTGWNLNWWEITNQTATITTKSTTAPQALLSSEQAAVEVFPNPVTGQFLLKVDNEFAGQLTASIINVSGQSLKQFQLSKAKGSSQWNLSAAGIPNGTYILQVTMTGWNRTIKLIKE